jgi:hypothetical protein
MSPSRHGPRFVLACAAAALWLAAGAGAPRAAHPAFFPDDPIAVDPESEDASAVRPWEVSDPYDFLENTFLKPGDRSPRRALNVNTIDEVPDSSWFTNRGPLDAATVARGPDTSDGPAPGPWTIVSGKSDGITPGFTIRDAEGTTWFIKFDPPQHPEMATGAEIVSTKLFWALGYHVPENHLATLRRDHLVIGARAGIRNATGQRRQITQSDVDDLLAQAARHDDGTYRVVASRALPGRPLGPFRYYGTRPDDPNDIFPHEHRRELRGLRAAAAWLNHDDSRSINTLDTLVERDGRRLVWHHLIDFGSTLGSASVQAQKARAGNEYIWEARPTLLTALSLGFWVRPWIKVRYLDLPALGRIEAAFFQPETWKPEYPNPAFDNARPDDLFWAARRVASMSDEAIAAAVQAAAFSDVNATRYLTDVIIARRDKVGLAWLPAVNPLTDFALAADGTLTFRNAAVDTGRATPARAYRVQWSRFDNATHEASPIGPAETIAAAAVRAPQEARASAFLQVEVSALHDTHPSWALPVRVQFRRTADAWQLVGLQRMPHLD